MSTEAYLNAPFTQPVSEWEAELLELPFTPAPATPAPAPAAPACPPAHADATVGAAYSRAAYQAFRIMLALGQAGAQGLAQELRAQGRGGELWDTARFMDGMLQSDPYALGVIVNDPNQGRAVRLIHRRFLLGA